MRLINEPRYESWNTQAMPKSYLPMHALRARAGHKLISCDFDSLELLLVGELSREPNIVKLMLPGAPPNDLHIMTATSFPAPFGTTMRSLGYDPEKPTKDALDRIKADEKGSKLRSVAKTARFSLQYGCRPRRFHSTLLKEGFKEIDFETANSIYDSFWNFYSVEREWEAELTRQWEWNGGWVLNGLGCPMAIAEAKQRDIKSRVIQSTGAQLTFLWTAIYTNMLIERKLPYQPWVINWHDAGIVESPDSAVAEVAHVMEVEATKELNELVQGLLPLKMSATIHTTLAEDKCKVDFRSEKGQLLFNLLSELDPTFNGGMK
jgi:hypothetical protein